MRFQQTRDLEAVRRAIAGDPRIWAAAGDDSAPPPDEWRPPEDPRIIYVQASDASRLVATFTLCPQNSVCYELHMDRVYGAGPARALRELFPWAFEHTPAKRIVASIPADNPIAIRAARRAGMEQYGINPRSFQRRAELHDQILLGVSKCLQQSQG